MKQIVARLSYSNVIATIALFLALGGGAYAAKGHGSKSPKPEWNLVQNQVDSPDIATEAVGPRQIEKEAVGPKQIEKGAVGTRQMDEKSVTPEKVSPTVWDRVKNISDDQIEAEMGSLRGTTGPQGATGAQGAQGVAGTPGSEGAQGKEGPAGEEGPSGAPGTVGPWASVGASGNLVHSSGVASASQPSGAEPGSYVVIFDRDVVTCAITATIADEQTTDGVSTGPTTGETAVSGLSGNADGIVVSTAENHGNPVNRPFFVTVQC